MFRSRRGADQVHGPLAVLALGFTDNVDMAPGLVLDITDCFTAAAYDKSYSTIRYIYLCAFFCLAKRKDEKLAFLSFVLWKR